MTTTIADTGVVIGKFLPLHNGHLHLIRVAQRLVERLFIVVCSLPDEPIPGELRARWARRLCPEASVLHLDEVLPATPDEHVDFWPMWRLALRRILPERPAVLFASEAYGTRLAAELGCRFRPVDIERIAVPVRGTDIRPDVYAHWRFLPPSVRAYYVKRVCVFGPESVGKTTLSERLAEHYRTVWAPEYARAYLEHRGGELVETDLFEIAAGQRALEESLAEQADKLLFMDTDTLTTELWANRLYSRCDPRIAALALERPADLYLLCDVDVPWIEDRVRYLPADRNDFFRVFEETLRQRSLPYTVIRGSWQERWDAALAAVGRPFGHLLRA